MGGELYSSLFIGPNDYKSLLEWADIFGVLNKDKCVKELKQSVYNWDDQDDKEFSDEEERKEYELEGYNIILTENCDYIFDDCSKDFFKKLSLFDLKIVMDNNVSNEKVRIGRKINNIRENIKKDKELWENVGIKNIDIFSGLYGDGPLSYGEFPEHLLNV